MGDKTLLWVRMGMIWSELVRMATSGHGSENRKPTKKSPKSSGGSKVDESNAEGQDTFQIQSNLVEEAGSSEANRANDSVEHTLFLPLNSTLSSFPPTILSKTDLALALRVRTRKRARNTLHGSTSALSTACSQGVSLTPSLPPHMLHPHPAKAWTCAVKNSAAVKITLIVEMKGNCILSV